MLNWYKNSVESAPERSSQGTGELILDPHYKILAVSLKYVISGKLSVVPLCYKLTLGRRCNALYPFDFLLSSRDRYFLHRSQLLFGSCSHRISKYQKRRQKTLASSSYLPSTFTSFVPNLDCASSRSSTMRYPQCEN